MLNNLKYVLGVLAIIIGAVATFDNGMMPFLRYALIYGSSVTIAFVLLHSLYMDVDNTSTLEKIRDEQ